MTTLSKTQNKSLQIINSNKNSTEGYLKFINI